MNATWAVARERPEQDSNSELCNAGAVLYQLSYRASWELAVMWVHDCVDPYNNNILNYGISYTSWC